MNLSSWARDFCRGKKNGFLFFGAVDIGGAGLAVAALLVEVALLSGGCASKQGKEEYGALRLYVSVNPDQTGRFQMVSIYRRSPIQFAISPSPFLDEGYVREAKVVEAPGGFRLWIQYDRRGAGLLENMTHRFRNRHLAIYAAFPEGRWLAAPAIEKPIRDGVLVFTPDATRKEAERIARGLNRLAAKIREQ